MNKINFLTSCRCLMFPTPHLLNFQAVAVSFSIRKTTNQSSWQTLEEENENQTPKLYNKSLINVQTPCFLTFYNDVSIGARCRVCLLLKRFNMSGYFLVYLKRFLFTTTKCFREQILLNLLSKALWLAFKVSRLRRLVNQYLMLWKS